MPQTGSIRPPDTPEACAPQLAGPCVPRQGLGGWASRGVLDQAARRAERVRGGDVDPLRELGIDTAVWIGIPGFSRFRSDRLGPGGLQALSSIAQLDEIPRHERDRARAWALSHYDDPVHRADLATIWRRPSWLPSGGPNPDGVAPHERWRPLLTFLDTVRMVFTTANKERAGVFEAHGHDYRKALPKLLREAFDFHHVDDAELARITEQVRQSELWIMQQEWK